MGHAIDLGVPSEYEEETLGISVEQSLAPGGWKMLQGREARNTVGSWLHTKYGFKYIPESDEGRPLGNTSLE